MSHKIATVVLSAAVASAGTITVQYPTGTSAGDFATYGHKMWSRGLQKMFSQDDGNISVSFGASDITVTYSGATSIPANTQCTFELNIAGVADAPTNIVGPKRMSYTPLMRLDLGAPDTADADGVVESQNLTALGVYSTLAFNGVYGDPYGNAYAVLDVPRALVAAWTATAILTVTGEDEYGDVIVEKSASGTSFTGKKAFKKITSIATNADITALTVGTSDVLGLPVYVGKASHVFDELQDEVSIGGIGSGKILIPFDFNETDLLAGTAQNLVAPAAGYITGMRAIVQKTVTTGGAITVEANTVAVVGLSVTVANSDAPPTAYSDTVLKIATGLCAAGDDITVTPAAAFATAGAVKGYLIFEPVAAFNGTFVAGVQTTPTATTGDVRGTYKPSELCNNALSFGLIAYVPDPAYRGVDNYDG